MAVVVPAPPVLSGDLSLFSTTDPLLSNLPVLVFHGPAASIGATSSRIQLHVFSAAGHASYARLAVSPNSPFYSAVSNLPREEQGDEVCRGLAFGLRKYFFELAENVKKTWCTVAKVPSPSALFGDEHVAILATRMTHVDNAEEVVEILGKTFREERLSWMDVDVILPSGSIEEPVRSADAASPNDLDVSQHLHQMYGKYAELIESLGDAVFLPTSKLKRAPSKASVIGRSASFLRHQKENVRKELTELVDTETSYVQRITELYDIAGRLGSELDPDTQDQLHSVFPSSLQSIVNINTDFLKVLRAIFDATEHDALRDIEAMEDDRPNARQARQDFVEDTQGVGAFAKRLCEMLPKFKDCYGEFLRDHAACAQLLRDLSKNDPAIAATIQGVGEQKLASLLIEPVQRLPRYSLYIDSITKQLPARHPAIKELLKARDIVSEICDQDGLGESATTIIEKLRARISGWPIHTQVAGRLVTAVDVLELDSTDLLRDCETPGVLLLFTDCVVILEKQDLSATSARNLLAEVENGPSALLSMRSRPSTPQNLKFKKWVSLKEFEYLEGGDGETLQIFLHEATESGLDTTLSVIRIRQTLRLEGFYERKVERLAEEITKARLEGRFSELERESSKWEVRASDPVADTASLLSAIFEDSDQAHISMRQNLASVRIIIDIDRHSQKPRAGQNGIQTIVCVTPLRDGLWRVSFDSIDGSIKHENVSVLDVVITIRRRLALLTCARFAIAEDSLTASLLAGNAKALQSIDLRSSQSDGESVKPSSISEKTKNPKSPRKFLSSFLSSSSGPGSQPPALLKKDLPPLPPPAQGSRYTIVIPSKPPSRESRPPSRDQPTPKSISSMFSTEQLSSPIQKLEETLASYLLALEARKGNIVGRSLKMRSTADELAVNELYNSLLEDPNTMVLAAQASVDVLFAAFEKFVAVAWKNQIGQLLPLPILQDIQAKAETMFPADFDQFFRRALDSLPPQNQRAFKNIMKLLADLLDGTGNDSDRGILTAAFAEVLVPHGNALEYIALIDRFVDDPDTYFGEPLEDVQKTADTAASSHKRARSVNSASVSSNTSSLRRKFGFGALARDNSKSEPESKMASVWRTLSKSTRGNASPGSSISKGTLHRAYTTDPRGLPSRPTSQDGALQKTSEFGDDSSLLSTGTAQNLGLSTIGEHPSFIPKQPPRKKRRSSLSDLKDLDDVSSKSPLWAPPAARPILAAQTQLTNSPPPSTPSSKDGSGRFLTPSKEPPRSRLPPSFRKENSPGPSRALATAEPSSGDPSTADEIFITARSLSNIPTLSTKSSPQKGTSPLSGRAAALFERRDAGNAIKKPSPPANKAVSSTTISTAENGSPKKLRMQSPQKLRERLLNEQSAVTATQDSLQDELSKIGDELTSTPSRINSFRTTGWPGPRGQSGPLDLAARVLKMEGQLPQQIDELQSRIAAIQDDLTTSLTVSESKCKRLDALYREANSENEALYSRFNDELSRISKAVRGGDGVEELKRKLKEAQEEAAKFKRDNGRLKRENLGLRSQLKE